MEDLQHENVKRVFQRQTNDCPAVPTCATPTGTEYRSADGSCNNKDNPAWGQAGQAQSRIVDPAYGKNIYIFSESSIINVISGSTCISDDIPPQIEILNRLSHSNALLKTVFLQEGITCKMQYVEPNKTACQLHKTTCKPMKSFVT